MDMNFVLPNELHDAFKVALQEEDKMKHVAVTYEDGIVRVYKDGDLYATRSTRGPFTVAISDIEALKEEK
jgi:hypothetical protein